MRLAFRTPAHVAEGQHTQGLLWALEGAGLDVPNHASRARRLAVLARARCSPHLHGACGGMSAKRAEAEQ